MHHIFHVHSHITFLICNKYISDFQLDPNQCVFLCMRYYSLPDTYRSIYKNVVLYPKEVFGKDEFDIFPKLNVIAGKKNSRRLESYINKLIGDDSFTYYAIQTSSHFVSFIVTMRNCKGYYLLEEGKSAYLKPQELDDLLGYTLKGWKKMAYNFLLRPLFYRFFATKGSAFSTSNRHYLGTLGTSEKAFRYFPKEHLIVSNPFETIEMDKIPEAILSIDGSIIAFELSLSDIQQLFERLKVVFNSRGYTRIAFKFHPLFNSNPALSKALSSQIHDIFGENSFQLPADCIIENILSTYPVDFYSDWSSIGIYASFFKRRCFSYANIMASIVNSERYDQLVTGLPPVITDNYTFL